MKSTPTCISLDLHAAHPFAHSNEGIVVFLQALICFLIQAGKGSELCPVKFLTLEVKDDSKGRHDAVEVGLLTASPSDGDKNTREEI